VYRSLGKGALETEALVVDLCTFCGRLALASNNYERFDDVDPRAIVPCAWAVAAKPASPSQRPLAGR
jgi:hypothetical protein